MTHYYTAIMFLCVFSMIVMEYCINISSTLAHSRKHLFKLLFICVIVAAFCEWLGIILQSTGSYTVILHAAVKAIELSIAPFTGYIIGYVINGHENKPVLYFLLVHALLEVLSAFTGFIYHVDSMSLYTHASCYWIYVLAYVVSIFYCMFAVVKNMHRYQYNGVTFLSLITVFLASGLVIQTVYPELRVDYICIGITSILLYIFTLEMIQQNDELTGLINRRGYDNYIAHVEEPCVIIFFDVDHFKNINDQYGHSFGDECLKETGSALRTAYAEYGRCFRIGGDEFCVILSKKLDEVESLNSVFFKEMDRLRHQEKRLPYVSAGYVYFDPRSRSIHEAVEEADQMMYRYKQEHRSIEQQ